MNPQVEETAKRTREAIGKAQATGDEAIDFANRKIQEIRRKAGNLKGTPDELAEMEITEELEKIKREQQLRERERRRKSGGR
ncbi:MAG: hypothetical protein A2857_00490 [Candidatus Levybacteria bacterium RIFCSPHIGHO2_01_FULL_36_15]|nr:MAG: hypothetical protein A2857_00490 [Candidatus Levybacteria bacterium RIFCSPHIGHO2_01_FULL_36_15]OGH38915.1 MAG: hypothetical protein A2905_03705 [Candidatus Levybacteria bacterium RIFCSPLOWO2_01_FULL_36_10]